LRYSAPVRRQAGFTLLELMITIAVIAVIAAIALPSLFSEVRTARASAEVQPMFNDLRVRIEQYAQENGKYPDTIGEGTLHPNGAPAPAPVAINPLPATWQAVRIRVSGADRVACRYTWVTGLASDPANIGAIGGATFGFTAPSVDWYYLFARCNMKGSGSDVYYFASSSDPTLLMFDPDDVRGVVRSAH
jgi:prepilin-type N-terminal cleavage/methylation domain-containing protein